MKNFILVLLSFVITTLGFAQTANHVVISEVFYLGATGANEFVELYNTTGADIVLNGFVLQAGTSGTPGTNTGEWSIDLTGKTIKAFGYLLIGGSAVTPAADLSIPAGKDLKNSGIRAGVRLFNTGTSSSIDGIAWDATANVGIEQSANLTAGVTSSNPKSLERKARSSSTQISMSAEDATLGNGYDTNDNTVDFVLRDVPQPQNSSSPTESPSTGPDLIPPTIFSVKPQSATQIEVAFNEPVDSVTASTSVNYSLDNGITVSQAVRNSVSLSKVTLTVSALVNGVYTLTVQNVKDTAGNAISTPQISKFTYGTVTIAQARALGEGASIRVKGIITVANEFKSPSYLQDGTAGLAVFNNNFSTGSKIGDEWEIAGSLKNFNGLLEVDPVKDSVKVSTNNSLPDVKRLNSTQLNESVESQLVRVNKIQFVASGNFAAGVDSNYAANDAFGPLTIYIDKDSNIPGTPIPTDSVNLIGVVNERSGVYRLLPRMLADVNVIDPPSSQTWLDINIARSKSDGDTVKVRGVVTYAQPSKTAAKTIFIQDFSGGISLYDAKTDTLLLGDSIEVKGVLKTYSNLLEMQPVDSLKLFARGLTLPAAKNITITQASEIYESQLVKLFKVRFVEAGTFSGGTSGTTYHITDGANQLDVRIPFNSALAGTTIPVGLLDIVGVLGQFNAAYQLIPRTSDDLFVMPGPQITSSPVITALADTSFNLTWTTFFDGTSVVYFGSTKSLGDSIVVDPPTMNHSVTIGGLKSGRIYYYQAFSANGSGVSSSFIAPMVTTSSTSSGEMDIYFNYSTDTTYHIQPRANGKVNLLSKLLDRIHAAAKSIDIALYSFDDFSGTAGVVSDRVADSLIAAYHRGIKVRMVFDNKTTSTPLGKLITAGIPVVKRSIPGIDNGIMHNKFFIFDGRDTTSAVDDWVISGSWNVTNEGTVKDAQNAVFVQDQSLARIYTVEFEEMFGSSTDSPNLGQAHFGPTKQDNTPHYTIVGGKKVEIYFSPSDHTTSNIIRTLSTADKNIFFGLLAYTRDDIAQTMIARKNAGVIVRGMIDQQPSVLGTLQGAGIDAFEPSHSVVTGLFHHKYAVVDPFNDGSDPVVITGSHNWSSAAENDNDENTLIIHSGDIARQYAQEFADRYKESGGTGIITTVHQSSSVVPDAFALAQNYPNPFNPSTTIQFDVAKSGLVSINIYDILGREVALLVHQNFSTGVYTVQWNAATLSSGVYFYRMQAGNFAAVRKLMLQK